MNRIVISYRRQDSSNITGRIYDRLVSRFGRDNVFKDVDTIPYGVDFRLEIGNAMAEASVLLAVIGDRWLGMAAEPDTGRIEDPNDFVRIEIEVALQRDIYLIPLLVNGASMPSEADLPDTIKALAYRNAIPIRNDPDFHHDMDRLIEFLSGVVGRSTPTSAGLGIQVRPAALPKPSTLTTQARLMHFTVQEIEGQLKRRLCGHELAVEAVMPWIKRLRFGFLRDDRPAATFLFIGQSGIGKTVFAKELARLISGEEDRLTFFSMGQFHGDLATSMLVGASEGYVNSRDGLLVNALRNSPNGVLFFDEINKADTRVVDLLIRFAESGLVQDATGRVFDGRNAIVIFSATISRNAPDSAESHDDPTSMVRAMVRAAEEALPLELVRRVDEVVCFLPLSMNAARTIVNTTIEGEVVKLSEAKGILLSVDETVKSLIGKEFYDASLNEGARAASRLVNTLLVVPVIDFIFMQASEQQPLENKEIEAVVDSSGNIVIRGVLNNCVDPDN